VKVRVIYQHGEPGVSTSVLAFDDSGRIAESVRTKAHGAAELPCLRGLKYELEAQTLHGRFPWRENILKSSRVPFTCGDSSATFELVLDHSAPF